MRRRKTGRVRMVVPIRMFVEDGANGKNAVLAHTLDATDFGARLGGVHASLERGQVVVVQYQHRRALFRVKWCGERGTRTSTQLGLECLETGKNVWGIEFPQKREQMKPNVA